MTKILCLAGSPLTAEAVVLPSNSALSHSLQTQTNYASRPGSHKRDCTKEELRHILLGSPGAIRQTIHLLHSLRYAEPVLWSPMMTVGKQMIITPEQGESMSLLRRSL